MSFQSGEIKQAIASFGRVARVTITAATGSTPREVGTSMLVWNGGQAGTIGGGALEFEAANIALSTKGLQKIPLGPALGQCCGGNVTLLTEHFDSNSVFSDEEKTTKQAIWIFGAGHVGHAIVSVLSPLPQFSITWIDISLDRFPSDDFTAVKKLPAADPTAAVKLAPADAHHLILTYSHALDLEICHSLLKHGFASCGLIGSDTKWARFRRKLIKLGHSMAEINQITCPIGDPSLGKHPQQIAVGVASSLLSPRTLTALGKDRAI